MPAAEPGASGLLVAGGTVSQNVAGRVYTVERL